MFARSSFSTQLIAHKTILTIENKIKDITNQEKLVTKLLKDFIVKWKYQKKKKLNTLKCLWVHGNTAQITGFNLWILVSALVFHVFPLFIVLHNFLLDDLPPSLASHVSFCPKIYFFIKAGISFQILGCTFVSEPWISLWRLLHQCVFLAGCNMSADRRSKVLWEMRFQLCAWETLILFLLQCHVFQNMKPTLGANQGHPSAQ